MKFRDQIAFVLGVAVLIFSLFVGVPSYMRGKAFSRARGFDDRTITVVKSRANLAGDVEIESADGARILFPGHTPFASYVYSSMWRGQIVLPASSQLRLHVTEEPQITPSWVKSGLLAREWEAATWLTVEIVDHF